MNDYREEIERIKQAGTDPANMARKRLLEICEELLRQRDGYIRECHEVEQVLGKALSKSQGFPWYKDSPQHFPYATEEDGVCVGEHVPGSLAMCAAHYIQELEQQRDRMRREVLET